MRFFQGFVLVGAMGLAVAGCTGGGGSGPATTVTVPASTSNVATAPAIDPAAVAWMDGLCGAVNGYHHTVSEDAKKPQPGGTSGAAAQKMVSESLARQAELAGKAVTELAALPASPAPAGETAKKSFLDKFTASRDAAANGKTKLDAAKRGSQSSIDAAIEAMNTAQNAVTDAYDPVAPIMSSPELSVASASAPKCKPAS